MTSPCPSTLPPTTLFALRGKKVSLSRCSPDQPDVAVIHLKRAEVEAWSSHNPEQTLRPLGHIPLCAFANLWNPSETLCTFGDLAPNVLLSFRTECGRHVTVGLVVTGVVSRSPCKTLTLVAKLADPSSPPWWWGQQQHQHQQPFVCGRDVCATVDGATLDPAALL